MQTKPVQTLIEQAIHDRVFPSCAVCTNCGDELVTALGKYTYTPDSMMVSEHTLYDVASLTKVMVTIPALMVLYDRGLLDLDAHVVDYFPGFARHGKEAITIKNLIMGTSGLTKIYGFDLNTTKEQLLEIIYDVVPEFPVGTQIYYNDISYILLGEIVRHITGVSLDKFIADNFFAPLGMHAAFGPLDPLLCAPSREQDSWFREKACQGFADDKKVYVMEHVAGFAGLFASIEDMQKFGQFMISDGMGIVSPDTMHHFLSSQEGCDKTLGWNVNTVKVPMRTMIGFTHHSVGQHAGLPDSPQFITTPGDSWPQSTIYHNGFTGTSILVDRESKTYLGLLSNRTYQMKHVSDMANFRKELYSLLHPSC